MTLAEEIAALDRMTLKELAARWSELTGGPAPKVRTTLMRLAVAWEVQARALGGHSRETIRRLEQIERDQTRTAPARPGMRLVREWNGKAHVVTVDASGRISWDDRHWNSLSEVAREITGTRWSGPAFFGLKKRLSA